MAIETAADFRRLKRAGVLSLAAILIFCAAAVGQAPLVSVGSVVPIPYNDSMNQIYKILFYKGNVLALDSGADVLYQLPPGGTSWNNLSGPGRNSNFLGGGYNAASMAVDAVGNLYITDGTPPSDAGTALFWRFPYDPVANTWHLSTAGAWGGNIIDPNNSPTAVVAEAGQGTQDVQFENSSAMDGSGTLYFVATAGQIFSIQVNADGSLPNTTATFIMNMADGGNAHMAIDAAGNIYVVSGHAINATNGVRPAGTTGIFFIPAGTTLPNSLANGQAEAYLQKQGWRVDNLQESSTSPVVYAGVTLDAAGNLYMTSEVNSGYAETFAGIWELPNVCGKPPTAANLNTCMDDGDIALLAPISSNQPLAIDSRGYLWIPTYQNYSPSGEGSEANVYAIAVFAPGVLNLNYPLLGPSSAETGSPTGKAGPAGILYVSFNGTYQPSAFQFSSASGSASEFGLTLTNPLPSPSSTTPTVPCNSTTGNVGGAYNTYSLTNSCLLWVTLDPTVPGPVSGELTMYSAGNPSYTVYVNGTGQGPGVGMLNAPQLNTLAAPTALNTPGQVATDPIGDAWVADSGEKQVLYFPAGSSSASGKSVGTGLSDPTGVAVDGTGDVYIADWNSSKKTGTVYEIPWVPNTTSAAGGAYGAQTIVATGFGNNLNLAVDGTGDVYVADPDNARVVKIPTPAQAFLVVNPEVAGDTSDKTTVTVGSGFTAPSAVAVDSAGDLFVADGTSLYEVSAFPSNAQTDITDSLPAPVTGLAVDSSGSVIAALSGEGLYRIPNFVTYGVGALSVNSASLIDTTVTLTDPSICGGVSGALGACTATVNVTSPEGVALDQQGNIYVTDMTNGPNLYQMNVVSGFVNFGVGLSPQVADEQDLDLFNIGNEPLSLTPNSYSFSGPDTADYCLAGIGNCQGSIGAGTACDTTGVATVATGGSCTLGPTFVPPALASNDLTPNIYSGDSLTVPTNAANINGGGTAIAALQAASINNLETTQTSVVVNLTSSTYPGSGSVTVNIAPAPGSQYTYPQSPGPTGTVVLTLSCASPGCTQPAIVETGTATVTGTGQNTSVTFNNLTGLDGGNYNVTADYEGSVLNLMGKSMGTATFTVNTATPVITLSEPVGVAPNATNGVYYLLSGATGSMVANVSSTVGFPTGTVTLIDATQGSLGAAIYSSQQNWIFSTGLLAPASYSLIASYGGDQNFSAVSTTVPVTFQVINPSVLLTASPSSVTTKAGTAVASTITIQSLVGFSALSGANITCQIASPDTVPPYSECTFDNPQPAICAPSATNNTCTPATTVLTLSTNIPVNIPASARNVPPGWSHASPFTLAGFFGLGLLGLAVRRRAIFNRYLLHLVCLMLFLAGTVMGIASCTNSGYTKTPKVPVYTTPSGTYNVSIQVTNTATGVVESLPFTLGVTIQ